MSVYYTIGATLAKLCFTLFARYNVDGKDAIPQIGPLIIVSNHISNADIPLIVISIPRKLSFLAKKGLFWGPIASSILDGIGVYPIERSGADIRATRWALKSLEKGNALLLFPEATRSNTGSMNKAGPGIAYLALKSQVPILPIAVTGTEHVPAMWRIPFPLCKMTVKVGDPFTLPLIKGPLSKDVLEDMSDMIMGHVAALLPERYQGHYKITSPT